MTNTLIKNGTIITDKKSVKKDILLKGRQIAAIDGHISEDESDYTIDASGMYVLPGFIDPHVHFNLPGHTGYSSDDFRSGTVAAIAGGTTTVIDFVTPDKGESLITALEKRKKIAASSLLDYGLHMGICGWQKNTSAEMKHCIEKEGISSFKVYLAYKDTIGIDDHILGEVMKYAAAYKALVMVHCENGDVIADLQQKYISKQQFRPLYHKKSRPPKTESEAIIKTISIARKSGCRLYIVHVSLAESGKIIKMAHEKGQIVYAETCPQYLMLNEHKYSLPFIESAKYVMSPPLRKKSDNQALWEGIKNETFQVVSTDHCPFYMKGQKDRGIRNFSEIPNGVGGIEHRPALIYTYGVLKNIISLQQWVAVCSSNPARIFGFYPRKGSMETGSDADIVIWNPAGKRIISAEHQFQQCDHTVFEGIKIEGAPEYVIVNGMLAFENGKLLNNEKLKGSFLYRSF